MSSMARVVLIALLIVGCGGYREGHLDDLSQSNSRIVAKPYIVQATAATIDCFPPDSGIRCESSALAVINGRLLVASDKEATAPFSSLISFVFDGDGLGLRSDYITSGALFAARKIEEFARSPEELIWFATTDFDWPTSDDSAEPDPYNTLLSWQDDPTQAVVVHPVEHLGVISSRDLRPRFAAALADESFPKGPPYFKIEGLAVVPGRHLFFGVRETGTDYEHPRFRFVVLAADFSVGADGTVKLSDTITKIYDEDVENSGHPMGLSAIAFDSERHGLWFAATSEAAEGQSGHSSRLWWAPFVSATDRLDPIPVLNENGGPFMLPHKLEGLVVLPDGQLAGVCDEDRARSLVFGTQTTRELYQGIYVRLEPRFE
jgi:hypothetical protein